MSHLDTFINFRSIYLKTIGYAHPAHLKHTNTRMLLSGAHTVQIIQLMKCNAIQLCYSHRWLKHKTERTHFQNNCKLDLEYQCNKEEVINALNKILLS